MNLFTKGTLTNSREMERAYVGRDPKVQSSISSKYGVVKSFSNLYQYLSSRRRHYFRVGFVNYYYYNMFHEELLSSTPKITLTLYKFESFAHFIAWYLLYVINLSDKSSTIL